MASNLLQPSFAGGELSPALYSRVDIARYGTSLRTCKNMIVRPYGGVDNRPGMRFVGEVKDSTEPARLIPFQYSSEIAYVIVANDGYFEFIYDGAFVESSPGVRVQVAVPYTSAEIAELKFTQSADVMYIAHKSHAPRELRRTSATSFTLSVFQPKDGPFTLINNDDSRKIGASATTGQVTLTANFEAFTAEMVGTLVYLEPKDLADITPWEPGDRNVAIGEKRRSDGKTYICEAYASNGGDNWYQTGANKPVHDVGSAWDGPGDQRTSGTDKYSVGVKWRYLHGGYGTVLITAFTDAYTVSATVIKTLPDAVVGSVGAPASSWTFSGDGSTTVFSVTGASSTNVLNYSVTIDGVPVQSNPYGTGGTGGGGGSTCVSVDAMLLSDGVAVRAGNVKVGDLLNLFDPSEWEPALGVVSYAETKEADLVRVVTAGGLMLTCSTTAPIPTKRGGLVPALSLMGHYIPTMVKGRKGWDVVMDVVLLGRGEVRHIAVGDRCFWAADAGSPGFILHHNLKPIPDV